MRWYVAGPDGSPHGPYDADALRGYAAEGRITGLTRVCVEGSTEWVPASSVAELGIAPATSVDPGLGLLVPVNMPVSVIIGSWLGFFSILGCLPLGPLALLLGWTGLREIRRRSATSTENTQQIGAIRAWTAIVTGSISTLVGIAAIIVYLVALST
jgi:hypothetical protein